MSNVVIRVDGVSKLYHIGAIQKRHDTLRDHLAESFKSLFRRNGRSVLSALRAAPSENTIWALKDLSFTVNHGEVVGIIGRNGAGKSTLLKILSRITEPTIGFAEIHGRVASLLEVGTGFHSELTGRENIYLNGAILGMKKAEIERKFDEIVAFAEVEKFIDTPVKHYSSGMYLRLAFAVAAHLEPEILIVDEVLAVGDANFQKKCLNKMKDVGQHGRTVLFVSHNMPAITRLCPRAILLDKGNVVEDGPSHQIVSTYLNSGLGTTAIREWPDPANAPGGEVARLRAVRVRTEDGTITNVVDINQPVRIDMEYDVRKPGYLLLPNFQFYNEEGIHVFSAHFDPVWQKRPRPKGRYISSLRIPGNLLSEGTMFIGVGCDTLAPQVFQFYEHDAVAFQVVENGNGNGVSARGYYEGRMGGVIRPLLKWNTEHFPED
jgi:lipopolysaccharide transport system ATP-binding protein